MQFSLLYGSQLDIELGSPDRTQLFTTARRQKAINDAMHDWERMTYCTPVYGTIPITNFASSAVVGSSGNAGTGYSVNDILTVSGGTFTTAAQFKVTAVSGGAISTLALQTAGLYTVLPSNAVTVTGGTGSGATITVTWAGTAEYGVFTNFSNFIRLQERKEPAIKQTDPNNNITWIQGDDLQRRDPAWLDREEPGWRADPSSTSMFWYLRNDLASGNSDSLFLGLDPAPLLTAGWNWTILFPYVGLSTDMAADTDQPFTVNSIQNKVIIPYHQALVHYAAGLLEPLRKNYDAAKRQMDLYGGYVTRYFTDQRRDAPDQVTFARNYFREATTPRRPVDPHRFP